MPAARLPESENARLEALRAFEVLDTAPEAQFDDLTLLASIICGTPIGFVTFLDRERQWFKSRLGFPHAEIPREQSFCAHAILVPDAIFEVSDATADARFADNPLVTGQPGFRFYAGAPLVMSSGQVLGTLCVFDRVPRKLGPKQSASLGIIARQVVALLELRAARREARVAREAASLQSEALAEYRSRLDRVSSQLSTQTVNDPLTGLYDRGAFTQHFSQAVLQARRDGDPLTLMMIDVDRFRALNDTFGHLAGDEALRRIADVLRESSRKADIAARYGGEEFAVILPATDEKGALLLAERFRRKVETTRWPHRKVTICVGLATRMANDPRCDVQQMIADAQAALARAKTLGRNRVITAAELERLTALKPAVGAAEGSTAPDGAAAGVPEQSGTGMDNAATPTMASTESGAATDPGGPPL